MIKLFWLGAFTFTLNGDDGTLIFFDTVDLLHWKLSVVKWVLNKVEEFWFDWFFCLNIDLILGEWLIDNFGVGWLYGSMGNWCWLLSL